MQRINFLKKLSLSSLLVYCSFGTFARSVRKHYYNKAGFKVNAGEDRNNKPLTLFQGDTFFGKISGNDCDNNLYIFESDRLEKGGPAAHFHYEQDEWWYIMEGVFLFKIGDKSFTAKKGDSVFGPRNIPHAFAKINSGKAKVLILFQPAGKMEAYFKAESEGFTRNMTDEQRNDFKKLHGFEVVGPALTHEKK